MCILKLINICDRENFCCVFDLNLSKHSTTFIFSMSEVVSHNANYAFSVIDIFKLPYTHGIYSVSEKTTTILYRSFRCSSENVMVQMHLTSLSIHHSTMKNYSWWFGDQPLRHSPTSMIIVWIKATYKNLFLASGKGSFRNWSFVYCRIHSQGYKMNISVAQLILKVRHYFWKGSEFVENFPWNIKLEIGFLTMDSVLTSHQ